MNYVLADHYNFESRLWVDKDGGSDKIYESTAAIEEEMMVSSTVDYDSGNGEDIKKWWWNITSTASWK